MTGPSVRTLELETAFLGLGPLGHDALPAFQGVRGGRLRFRAMNHNALASGISEAVAWGEWS